MSEKTDLIITAIGISIIILSIGIGIYILIKKVKRQTDKFMAEKFPKLKGQAETLKGQTKTLIGKTKESYKDFKQKYMTKNELNIEVDLGIDSIKVKNKESFELKNLELKLNRVVPTLTSAFKYIIKSLKPQEEIEVPVVEFTDKEGYRLDKEKVKIINLRIDYFGEDAKGWLTFDKEF